MSAGSADNVSLGLPVEIGRIERELKTLWEQSGNAKTRASLMNLAVYSEERGSLQRNTALISRVTENHACRAIVISGEGEADGAAVESWISAHCHVTRAGSNQICSEQISFLLPRASAALLANVLFSHTDSDLPLSLWWQDEFPEEMDPQLWSWVDRVIYDSQAWRNFDAQLERIEAAQAETNQRIVLCDLNWTRIVHLRLAIAQFFDHPSSHTQLEESTALDVEHAPGFRSTAVLLAGWLAAQLGWENGRRDGDNALAFATEEGAPVIISLAETDGEPISRVVLRFGATEYCVLHSPGGDLLDVTVLQEGKPRMHQLMPAGENDPVRLMTEELMRGGPHRVYLRAINAVRKLV